VPLVGSVPFHAPLALHDVALLEVQVRVAELPAAIVGDDAFRDTIGAGTTRASPPPHAEASRANPAMGTQEIKRTYTPSKDFVIMIRHADSVPLDYAC
jgi:hypothetical protein